MFDKEKYFNLYACIWKVNHSHNWKLQDDYIDVQF